MLLTYALKLLDKYLAVYDGEQVKIYEFDNVQDCHLHHSKPCPNSQSLDLSSLHVCNMESSTESSNTNDKSYLLIGVSAINKSITTWQLIIPSEQQTHGIEIIYGGTKEMPWSSYNSQTVVSASQWATNTASKLLHRLAALEKRHVLIVSLDSQVIFYGVNDTDTQDNVDWEPLFTLETSLSDIQHIRYAPGVVSIVSGKESKTLSIWMEMRAGVAPDLSKTFEFEEPIRDIAWNVTSDAQFMLAVAFPRKVAIFGQKRATHASFNYDGIWTLYTEFLVDT